MRAAQGRELPPGRMAIHGRNLRFINSRWFTRILPFTPVSHFAYAFNELAETEIYPLPEKKFMVNEDGPRDPNAPPTTHRAGKRDVPSLSLVIPCAPCRAGLGFVFVARLKSPTGAP